MTNKFVNMNQKGFVKIVSIGIIIVFIVVIVGAVGYFALYKATTTPKPLPTTQVTPPTASQSSHTPPPIAPSKTPPSAKGGGPTDGNPLPKDVKATIDKDSLMSSSGNVIISGTASGVSVIGVVATDINGYTTFTNIDPVRVVDGRWSITISDNIPKTATSQSLADGAYQVTVFGPNDIALARGILVVGTITSNPSNPPQLVFSLVPSVVPVGQYSTIYWRAPNATSCEASGDWSGSKFILGDTSTGKIDSSKSYTLTCQGAGGSVTKTVQVAPY